MIKLQLKTDKMKLKTLSLIAICTAILVSCSKEKKTTIELPLSLQNGYGFFNFGLGEISPYYDEENSPWRKTFLTVTGAPENWTEVKFGCIEINYCQSAYQDYLLGNITKEIYEDYQKRINWVPDTLALSKEPLKTKVAFAFGKDSVGVTNIIVDANNNLDFSDDKSFIPFNFTPSKTINQDSIVLSKVINISFERLVNGKKQLITAPILIVYMTLYDIFMCNFPQYYVTELDGKKIALCCKDFTDMSYEDYSIALINDSLKDGDKISYENLIAKNEFIEIRGNLYKNIGVNTNSNTLTLEKMSLTKSELYSKQIGFKSIPFEGKDFMTESPISLKDLKGKYVFLDFWAVWCGPCLQEIPKLKDLYEKTDREKFEIIGIVGRSSSDQLKKIVENDSITWTQILSTDSNKVKEAYGVNTFPTTFLLDPEGIIIAKDLRGKELEDKVLSLIRE